MFIVMDILWICSPVMTDNKIAAARFFWQVDGTKPATSILHSHCLIRSIVAVKYLLDKQLTDEEVHTRIPRSFPSRRIYYVVILARNFFRKGPKVPPASSCSILRVTIRSYLAWWMILVDCKLLCPPTRRLAYVFSPEENIYLVAMTGCECEGEVGRRR